MCSFLQRCIQQPVVFDLQLQRALKRSGVVAIVAVNASVEDIKRHWINVWTRTGFTAAEQLQLLKDLEWYNYADAVKYNLP